MKNYIVYFDSGTTNSRIFLLEKDFTVVASNKYPLGSRDVAKNGSPDVLIRGLYRIYCDILESNNLTDSDVSEIFVSGNATGKDGIKEVPYQILPVDEDSVAAGVFCFDEKTSFKREIHLIPGVKTDSPDITLIGNMRGEETEVLGITGVLEKQGYDNVAVLLPGSHTQIAYVQNGKLTDCISNFTGELFHALKEETLLKTVLSAEGSEVDVEMVNLALNNIEKLGFNRSLYLAHTMRILDLFPMNRIFSYAESVINGGIKKVLEQACATRWNDCSTAAILGNNHYCELFRAIFDDSKYIKTIMDIPQDNVNYALEGFKKIYRKWKENNK